jgi:hypothetical protein
LEQCCPLGQTLPHLPQLAGSDLVSVHWPLQTVVPDGQAHLQLLVRTWPPVQAGTQAPRQETRFPL